MKKSILLGAVCTAVTFKSNFKSEHLRMRVMKKLLMLVILFVSSHLVNASIVVVGPQMLSDGRTVDLQGLQWLDYGTHPCSPLDCNFSQQAAGDQSYTSDLNLTRDQVEATVLDSVSGGGWAYASVDQTTKLMASLLGDGSTTDTIIGAEWFLVAFGQTDDWAGPASAFRYGSSDECGLNVSCVSGVELDINFDPYDPSDVQYAHICYIFGDGCGGPVYGEGPVPDDEPNGAGHLLVRAVPIPPAFYLFGSGLLGLIGIARRKKK